MNLSFEQTLVEVWRQALVENANFVELGKARYPVRKTPKRGLRQVDFVFDGDEIRGLEQNPVAGELLFHPLFLRIPRLATILRCAIWWFSSSISFLPWSACSHLAVSVPSLLSPFSSSTNSCLWRIVISPIIPQCCCSQSSISRPTMESTGFTNAVAVLLTGTCRRQVRVEGHRTCLNRLS